MKTKTSFKEGDTPATGHSNATSENRMWGRALKKVLKEYNPKEHSRFEHYMVLQDIAKVVVDLALEGHPQSIQEIGNRLDGKSTEHKVVDKSVTHEFGDVSEAVGILKRFAGQRKDHDDEGAVSH